MGGQNPEPLETMKSHCLLVFTGESSFLGFLGGAKWILSIRNMGVFPSKSEKEKKAGKKTTKPLNTGTAGTLLTNRG